MVFDVDKLKEALKTDDESAERDELLLDAARMVVAGQPLWWCEEHETAATVGIDRCDWMLEEDAEVHCVMVEGWWMPTGTSE